MLAGVAGGGGGGAPPPPPPPPPPPAPAAPDRDAVGAASRPYTLGLACLEPTRLYSRLCLELENQGGEAAWYAGDFSQDLDGNRTHAFAHVTGGGLAANLARVIPAGLHVVVDRGSWPVPGIFKFLMSAGGLQPVEVEDAWNLGIGMVVAVHPDFVPTTHEAAAAHGIESFTIGRVTDQPPASAQVTGARTVSGTKGIVAGAVTLHGSYCV
ncbi:AIR synthase-related protein [Mobiluncus mulieris]|uniref:AIR synthase-related protein n=1 Tax=Mobiluncus mulieris TaxID=2052 RepID=UPI0032119B8E